MGGAVKSVSSFAGGIVNDVMGGVMGETPKMKGFSLSPEMIAAEQAMIKRQEKIAQGKDSMAMDMAQRAGASSAASARGMANPALAQRAAQQIAIEQGLAAQQAQRQAADQAIAAQAASQRGVALNQAQANLQAQQGAQANKMQLIGGLGQAAMMMSDENAKENIQPLTKQDLDKFMKALKGYKFDYKDKENGEGKKAGVMAQDLEKSDVGKQAVVNTPKGKMVDYAKLIPALAATIAEQDERIKKMES